MGYLWNNFSISDEIKLSEPTDQNLFIIIIPIVVVLVILVLVIIATFLVLLRKRGKSKKLSSFFLDTLA